MKTRITIISGFLGSGKTTLLKRFLDWEFDHGVTPRVIMSEFGDFDVDGKIIADERLQVSAVTGGCICCTNRDELADTVRNLLKTGNGAPIYIETTGVADPAGVLQAVLTIARRNDAFIGPVLVVYDASQHGKSGTDTILIEKQLMTADCIVLNKADLAQTDIARVESDVRAINPRATIVTVVQADIDLESATQGRTATFAGMGDAMETADNYGSFAVKLDARLNRAAFQKWLNSLPEEVVRLKGFVRFAGENGIFEVQKSRGQATVTLFDTARWMDATLVAITRPMPPDTLLKSLAACIQPEEKQG